MTRLPKQHLRKRSVHAKKNNNKHKKSTRKRSNVKKRQTRKIRQKKMMKGGVIFSGSIDNAIVKDVRFYATIDDDVNIVDIRDDLRSGLIDAGLRVDNIRMSLLNERHEGQLRLLVEVTLPLDIDTDTSETSDYALTLPALMELIQLLEVTRLFDIEGIRYSGPHEDTFEEN